MPDDEEERSPVGTFIDLLESLGFQRRSDAARAAASKRPAQVWIRWRALESGGVEIVACTTTKLLDPLPEGQHEGMFR
jgi:hypothetical protein